MRALGKKVWLEDKVIIRYFDIVINESIRLPIYLANKLKLNTQTHGL